MQSAGCVVPESVAFVFGFLGVAHASAAEGIVSAVIVALPSLDIAAHFQYTLEMLSV